jgi:hypothetical protein
MAKQFSNPAEIARVGEKVYDRKYRVGYERSHNGEFVAIDVRSEKAYVAATPEGAIAQGKREAPNGLFHLIKIGSPGAFRVSSTSHADNSRIFRS